MYVEADRQVRLRHGMDGRHVGLREPLLDGAEDRYECEPAAGRGNRAARASLIPRWSPCILAVLRGVDRRRSNAIAEHPTCLPSRSPWLVHGRATEREHVLPGRL